jgi:hypothetical protein
MRFRFACLLVCLPLLYACGPDKAELERRATALGTPCDFLLSSSAREQFGIAEGTDVEPHEVPRASGSNHYGCVLTWTGREGSVVLGFDLYLFSGRGPEPAARVQQLLDKGEYRAAQQFSYQAVNGVGDLAAYNGRLNMLAWGYRGHLMYLNATETSRSDQRALAAFAQSLNNNWPSG